MVTLLIALLLAGPAVKWKPGVVETTTYRHSESGLAGTSTYTVTGVLRENRRLFQVDVLSQRKLVLGGQEGKLESRGTTLVDAGTFDLVESRLTTSLNGAEASSLRAVRQGSKIEVTQKLRGSPEDKRVAEAPGPVVEESVLLFYLSRLPWKRGREFHWMRFSPAQGRLLHAAARVEGEEKKIMRVVVKTEIGTSNYQIRRGKPSVILKMDAGGTELLERETPGNPPRN